MPSSTNGGAHVKGENFTNEYKYPIKIYRIGQSIEFANGLELRKLVFSIILAGGMLGVFLLVGFTSESNVIRFILQNWLIMVTLIPTLITFIVFNLKYDGKGVIPFIKDRYKFYKTRKKAIEHFIEVPTSQMHKEMKFESFVVKDKGGGKHE